MDEIALAEFADRMWREMPHGGLHGDETLTDREVELINAELHRRGPRPPVSPGRSAHHASVTNSFIVTDLQGPLLRMPAKVTRFTFTPTGES